MFTFPRHGKTEFSSNSQYTILNTQYFPLQVKVLVPNSTAGMVIGKAGVYIRQIKEDSGAYVQISQKSKDLNLPERCVTIAGMYFHNNRMSFRLLCTMFYVLMYV